MISKKFIRNSLIYTIAGSLPMASAIILLPVYIEYLSTPVYGALILYTGFSLLIQILVTYSFDTSIYSYYHDYKHDQKKLKVFVSSVFTFVLLVGVATCALFFFLGDWVFKQVYADGEIIFFPYGVISMVSGIFQAVFKVNSSLLQTQEKAFSFLWNNLISFSLIAVLTIVGLHWFPNDLFGPIIGRLVAVGISGGWVLGTIYYQFGFHFDFSMIRSTFGFNHPSLLYQIMQWFNNSYDRVVLKLYLPLAQVGVYDFAAKCLTAIEFVLTGFYQSFFPKVLGTLALQTEKKTTVEINRYYNGLTAVTILLVGVCIFGMPIVLRFLVEWLNKPQYLEVIRWIPFIAVTYLLRSIRFYVAMPYAALKYAKPLPLFYLIIVAVKILAMVLLIPSLGIQGVIVSTWIGYSVELLVLFFGVRKKFAIQFNAFKLIIAPLLMAGVIIIAEPLVGDQYQLHLHAGYIAFGIGLLAWAYRNEVRQLEWSKIIK